MKSIVSIFLVFFFAGINLSHSQTIDIKVTPEGNMGIGTDDPGSTKLVVSKYGDNASLLKLDTQSPWEFLQIGVHNPSNGEYASLGLRSLYGNKEFRIQSPSGLYNAAIFKVSDTDFSNRVLLVPNGGKVSIGQDNPFGYQHSYDLSVQGRVIASTYWASSPPNWPDYVFDKNYLLPKLDEVEAFIQSEGHLPDVPSINEVKENGIDLITMESILLKKVEELTLYVIELSKENMEMKREIEKLKAEQKIKTPNKQ